MYNAAPVKECVSHEPHPGILISLNTSNSNIFPSYVLTPLTFIVLKRHHMVKLSCKWTTSTSKKPKTGSIV